MKLLPKYYLLTMLRRKFISSGFGGLLRDLWRLASQSVDPVRQEIRKRGKKFDLEYQVDTTGGVSAMALDINDEEAFQAGRYEPTPIDQFIEMINELPPIRKSSLLSIMVAERAAPCC